MGTRSRALAVIGGHAVEPSIPAVPAVTSRSGCAQAVTTILAADTRELLHYLPLLHVAPEIEVVHRARVSVRRLRSNLRTLGPIFDDDSWRSLSRQLAPVGEALGNVRDLDVLVESLEHRRTELPDRDHDAATLLVSRFADRRQPAIDTMIPFLRGDGVAAAVERTIAFAVAPPIIARADEPARLVLTELARRPWRRLARLAAQLDETSPFGRLHELRILVKRARYAAQAASLVRPAAAAHAAALARLQGTLGEINDATIIESRLQAEVASGMEGQAAYAAGLMVAAQRRHAQAQRALWPARWEAARRKKVRAWLDGSD